MSKIVISKTDLRNIIRESICNVMHIGKRYTFNEIKYFHPSGKTLPNGSHFQKGGFFE